MKIVTRKRLRESGVVARPTAASHSSESNGHAGSTLPAVLSEKIIPWVTEHGISRMVLAKPPLTTDALPSGVRVSRRSLREHPVKGRPVKSRGSRVRGVNARWPEDAQHALRFPYSCFVLEGEADFTIGDTVIHCPQGHGLLIPPGVPLPDGTRPHWERANIASAHSNIFWMLLWPFGAECHLCRTRGAAHEGGGFGERGYVADRQLFLLGEMLLDEMTQRRQQFETLSGAYLLSLLVLLHRHLENAEALPRPPLPSCIDSKDQDFVSDPDLTVSRAQKYIQDNLGKTLSLQEIAHAAYVSRARLAQLFQTQAGMTVWEYVTVRRIEEAKLLLQSTDISIDNVGRIIGFPQATHFCTRFSQLVGQSPGSFRKQQKEKQRKKPHANQ